MDWEYICNVKEVTISNWNSTRYKPLPEFLEHNTLKDSFTKSPTQSSSNEDDSQVVENSESFANSENNDFSDSILT